MAKYVLWDIDGTLLRNAAGGGGTLYDEAIAQVTGFTPPGQRPAEHGKVDGQIIAERLAEYDLPASLHTNVATRLDQLAVERHAGTDRRQIAPGVREAIAAVAGDGWTNALLTGNSPTRARAKLTGAGLDPDLFDWEHSYFGGTARTRTDVTAAASHALRGSAHVIIGDTPADDLAAAAAGIPFLAVATGAFPASVLRETRAVVVLDDLVSELDALLGALRAVPADGALSA